MPAVSHSYSITGNGGTKAIFITPEMNTDSLLRVRIKLGSAGQLSVPGTYSNFSAAYNCGKFKVELLFNNVVQETRETAMLSIGGGGTICPGAPSEEIIDLSSELVAGHGKFKIRISEPQYDFYCQMWTRCQVINQQTNYYYYGNYYYNPDPWAPMCANSYPTTARTYSCGAEGVKPVYKNHTMTGTMDVQINGSTL